MSRELRSRLVTLAVMVALAAVLIWQAGRADRLAAPVERGALLYPGLVPGEVTWLYLKLGSGQDLELQRTPGSAWRITAPGPEIARGDWVDVILDDLARATIEPIEEAGSEIRAEQVGLEPPRHIIGFGGEGWRERLLLGEIDPLGQRVYARRAGHASIVLATRNLVTLLQHHGQDFVDPALLRGLAGTVDLLRVRPGGAPGFTAVREGTQWRLHEPLAVPADAERLGTLVRSLQFARHETVLVSRPTDEESAAWGLPTDAQIAAGRTGDAWSIEAGASGEVPVRVWLPATWRATPDLVPVRRDDLPKIVGVRREALAMLENDTDFFRDRRLLPPVRERASGLRLVVEGATVLDVRARADGRWTFHAPDRLAGTLVETERFHGRSVLDDFLGSFDALLAVGFDDQPPGPPDAEILVDWMLSGVTRHDRIALEHQPREARYAASLAARPGERLLIEARAVEALLAPDAPDRLRSLAVLSGIDAGSWSRLQVLHPRVPEPLEVTRDPASGSWHGDDTWGRRFGLGRDLLHAFRGLDWAAAPADAAYPWQVRFFDAEGALLGGLLLRLPGPGDEEERLGLPAAYAVSLQHPGLELAVQRPWLESVDALDAPLRRQP